MLIREGNKCPACLCCMKEVVLALVVQCMHSSLINLLSEGCEAPLIMQVTRVAQKMYFKILFNDMYIMITYLVVQQ